MSKYDPKDAVKHIVHDYGSLVMAGSEKNLGYPCNHYAEGTFLTHCRALAEFFDHKEKGKDDLHARDFTKSKFNPKFPTWAKWSKHINTHLMHLTVGRIENTRPWNSKDNKTILKEFEAVWAKFMDEVKPGLRPLLEEELKKWNL
jgi:hypothetical protein